MCFWIQTYLSGLCGSNSVKLNCKLILTLVEFRFTLALISVYLVLCESSVMSLLKIYQIACVVINSPWKFPVALLKIY